MKSDKTPLASGMATRQKAIIAGVGVIVLIILWQLYSVYDSSKPMPGTTPVAGAGAGLKPAGSASQPGGLPPVHTPQQSTLVTGNNTEREETLAKIQRDTETSYITKMSELQLLKLTQQFAETNQAIMKAKLETVTAQKKIVDLLQTDAERANSTGQNNSQAMEAAMRNMQAAQQQLAQQQAIASYMVISVTQLQGQWRAVLGAQGRLFNVKVGDILPLDGAKVMAINSGGVTVERNGMTRRFSMVPVI